MNVISLVGRLTKDPELKTHTNGKSYCRFGLAVDNSYTSKNGERVDNADFINCLCWEKTAENLCKYMKKGNRIGLTGKLHTYSYDKEDGTKEYSYDVVISQLEYLESKSKDSRPEPDDLSTPVSQTSVTEQVAEENDPYKDFGDEFTLSADDLPF